MWDNWAKTENTTGPVVAEIVEGSYGSTAQRLRYQSVPGEYGHYLGLLQVTTGGTFAAGETATASFMLKASITGSVAIRLNLYARQGTSNIGVIDNNITTIVTKDWKRYSVTYTSLPAGTDAMMFYLYISGIDDGDTVDVSMDAAQLEKGAFATSYIPTTTTTATRNTDTITVPTNRWSTTEGTLIATTYYKSLNAGSQTQYLLTWKPNATNGIEAYLRNDLAASYLTTRKDGTLAFDVKTGLPIGAFVYGGTWNVGQVVRAFCDGVYSSVRSDIYVLPTGVFPNMASIGLNGINLPLGRFAIYDTALSDSQIASLNSLLKGP